MTHVFYIAFLRLDNERRIGVKNMCFLTQNVPPLTPGTEQVLQLTVRFHLPPPHEGGWFGENGAVEH